jgi:hypothetical protein
LRCAECIAAKAADHEYEPMGRRLRDQGYVVNG